MKASRYLLLLTVCALAVGFVSVDGSETAPEPLAMTDVFQSLVLEAPMCSATPSQVFGFPPPDLCAECLAACHPRDFLCIQACLNGPCI